MTVLPQDLEDFFLAARESELGHPHKPHWLHSETSDAVWMVACDSRARLVDGRWENLTRLIWTLTLPFDDLGDDPYETLLSDGKALFLAAFNGPDALQPYRLNDFHWLLIRLLEYLAVQHRDAAIKEGVRALNLDMCREYVLQYRGGGTSATAAITERWDAFVDRLVGRSGSKLYEVDSNAKPYSSAKYALEEAGFYDQDGRLKVRLVSEAVRIEPRRHCKLIFFRKHLEKFQLREESKTSRLRLLDRGDQDWDASKIVASLIRCGIAARSTHLSDWSLCDITALKDKVATLGGRQGTRTKTIPHRVAKQLVSASVDWLVNRSEALVKFVDEISQRALAQEVGDCNSSVSRLERAFAISQPPSHLNDLKIDGIWRRPVPNEVMPRDRPLSLFDVIDLHTAVCFCVISLFTCSRRSEVLELEDSDVWQRFGRWHVEIEVRKTGEAGMRRCISKPAPPLVGIAANSMIRMRQALSPLSTRSDPFVERRIFFGAVKAGRLLNVLVPEAIYAKLLLLSDWLDLRDATGVRWTIRPHQLRRLFAMSFFHHGGQENVLPALSWMMGHEEMHRTWTYIQEDLTGSEISSVEALLAVQAVRSDDDSETVKRLRGILGKQFGVTDLVVLNDTELQDYLEILQMNGVYRAVPKHIRDSNGMRYMVLIQLLAEDA